MIAYAFPVIQYGTFLTLLLMAVNQLIKAMYSSDERSYMRKRFINTLKSQQQKIIKVDSESKTNLLFRSAGYANMTDMKWLLIRIPLIFIPFIYFLMQADFFTAFVVLGILYISTETGIKFSPVVWFLREQKKSIQQKKEVELFTLFALLKTDLMASNTNQVNVYHLVSETTSYFKEINYVLVKFLSLWKKSPDDAGAVFQKELSGETASFIGDVLSKLHNMDRVDALNLLSEQGEVFTYKRSELAIQREEKKRLLFFILFFLASFAGIVWFLYFTYSMVSLNMNY